MKKFCCEEMTTHLRDNEVCIRYNEELNHYAIYYYFKGRKRLDTMHYCPWCGTKLNKDK